MPNNNTVRKPRKPHTPRPAPNLALVTYQIKELLESLRLIKRAIKQGDTTFRDGYEPGDKDVVL